MIKKAERTIKENNLIKAGDTVLCAVSGGADSVALLYCLKELSEQMGFTLKAAHFNHGIRGDEADADEMFVKVLCERLNIRCFFGRADVPRYAQENGYTCEQAGRILRYDFFNTINADRIATAHHMDDQAESIMLHITRGSGLAGLCGIRYERGKIIRPLLDVRRWEIERYLSERGAAYCIDSTNLTESGTRNKLRLSIIPQITDKINPRFTETLCEMAKIIRSEDDYMQSLAEAALRNCTVDNGYIKSKLKALDMPIRRRALIIAMQRAGAYADIEQKHVLIAEDMLSARTGAIAELPHINIYIEYDKICFVKKEKYSEIFTDTEFSVAFTVGDTETPIGCVTAEITEGNEFVSLPYTSFVDADKLPDNLLIRSRRAGDMIAPVGSGNKKLKDFFIDKKISRNERNMPLLCHENEVLCIIGMAVSKSVMITEKTSSMIKLTLKLKSKKEGNHERDL